MVRTRRGGSQEDAAEAPAEAQAAADGFLDQLSEALLKRGRLKWKARRSDTHRCMLHSRCLRRWL